MPSRINSGNTIAPISAPFGVITLNNFIPGSMSFLIFAITLILFFLTLIDLTLMPFCGTKVTLVKLAFPINFSNFPSTVAIFVIKFFPRISRDSLSPDFFTNAFIGSLICGLPTCFLPTCTLLGGATLSGIVAKDSFLFSIETLASPSAASAGTVNVVVSFSGSPFSV